MQFKEGWTARERHLIYGISMMLAVFLQVRSLGVTHRTDKTDNNGLLALTPHEQNNNRSSSAWPTPTTRPSGCTAGSAAPSTSGPSSSASPGTFHSFAVSKATSKLFADRTRALLPTKTQVRADEPRHQRRDGRRRGGLRHGGHHLRRLVLPEDRVRGASLSLSL